MGDYFYKYNPLFKKDIMDIYHSWININKSLYMKYYNLVALILMSLLIPLDFINIGVLILPWLEFIIGVCLIFGIFTDTSIVISLSLLSLFIMMIFQIYLIIRKLDY